MVFNYKFKYIWWVVLLVLGIFLLYTRFESIRAGNVGSFDTVLLAIVAGLLLIPLFSEITVLGISLKQQITNLKTEVKEEVKEVKDAVRNLVEFSNHNRFSPSIYVGGNPPPDNQLGEIEEFIKKTTKELMEQNSYSIPKTISLSIPEDNQYLFSVRYTIETEVKRIWLNYCDDINTNKQRHIAPIRMLVDLINNNILPSSFHKVIKEIYSICSPAIHGETPTRNQVSFIKDIADDVINSLKAIN